MTPSAPTVLEAVLHLDRAHAAARAVLGCDHLAADAVQEALVALWQQREAPAELRGWFVRAVVLRARHLRRTLRRRARHEQEAAHRCDLHPDCDNPLHHAQAHEVAARLDHARAELPDVQRAVFELHEATELDYAAVARRLDLPIGTVRSRLHRARQALQRAVADLGAPP